MHLNLNLKQVFTKYLYFIYKQKQPNLLEHFNSVDLFYFISVKLTTHLTRDRDKREVGKAGITVATVDRVPGLSHSTVDAENEPEPLWDRLVNSTVRKHHRSRCVHSVHTAHRNCPPEGVTLSWWRADPPGMSAPCAAGRTRPAGPRDRGVSQTRSLFPSDPWAHFIHELGSWDETCPKPLQEALRALSSLAMPRSASSSPTGCQSCGTRAAPGGGAGRGEGALAPSSLPPSRQASTACGGLPTRPEIFWMFAGKAASNNGRSVTGTRTRLSAGFINSETVTLSTETREVV